jgi:hypothetical protein
VPRLPIPVVEQENHPCITENQKSFSRINESINPTSEEEAATVEGAIQVPVVAINPLANLANMLSP